jgi:hypothetical protein
VPGSTTSPSEDDAEQEDEEPIVGAGATNAYAKADEQPLTIAEAKRRLAMSLGVSVDDIKITINS